ncbi:MAG TPA: hypothetical protein VFF03_01545 [Rhodocyclaceae bacterium]|nr:hypothetical protein [Rhodocyclaceae bacterium]
MLIDSTPPADQAAVDEIVSRGPVGAFALAGTAAAIVVAIWLAFYFLVYLPRA